MNRVWLGVGNTKGKAQYINVQRLDGAFRLTTDKYPFLKEGPLIQDGRIDVVCAKNDYAITKRHIRSLIEGFFLKELADADNNSSDVGRTDAKSTRASTVGKKTSAEKRGSDTLRVSARGNKLSESVGCGCEEVEMVEIDHSLDTESPSVGDKTI